MKIDFEKEFPKEDLGIRIRAILGVPEELLEDDVISSPTFIIKASNYVNKKIVDFDELTLEDNKDLLKISYLYYVSYLLCLGMYARVPKQMENVSTKTILQSIDWDSLALELLDKCNEIIDEVLEDIGEEIQYGNTFAVLSDESEYPNTSI